MEDQEARCKVPIVRPKHLLIGKWCGIYTGRNWSLSSRTDFVSRKPESQGGDRPLTRTKSDGSVPLVYLARNISVSRRRCNGLATLFEKLEGINWNKLGTISKLFADHREEYLI